MYCFDNSVDQDRQADPGSSVLHSACKYRQIARILQNIWIKFGEVYHDKG